MEHCKLNPKMLICWIELLSLFQRNNGKQFGNSGIAATSILVVSQHAQLPSQPSRDPAAAVLAEDDTSPGSRVFVALFSPGGRCAWSKWSRLLLDKRPCLLTLVIHQKKSDLMLTFLFTVVDQCIQTRLIFLPFNPMSNLIVPLGHACKGHRFQCRAAPSR